MFEIPDGRHWTEPCGGPLWDVSVRAGANQLRTETCCPPSKEGCDRDGEVVVVVVPAEGETNAVIAMIRAPSSWERTQSLAEL